MKRQWMAAVAAAGACLAGQGARAEWYDDVKLKGDVRMRYERIDDDSAAEVRDRERIRARLGFNYRVSSEVNAIIGLTTTENGDPISGNQTLTGGGTKKSVYLDLGYIDYHPEAAPGLSLLAGKMKNPYIAVADLVWDGDYTPEGMAVQYKTGEDVEFLLNGAVFALRENATGDDLYQGGPQAAVNFKSDSVEIMAGAAYTMTANFEGAQVLDYQGKNGTYGNSAASEVKGSVTNKLYKFDYSVIEPFFQVKFNTKTPVRFYGQYAVNTEADGYDTGYLAGFTVGQAKDPKTCEFTYNYRELEKDCVLGAFTDSDHGGGGTDNRGHKFQGKYQFAKNWQGALTYFLDEKKISSSNPVDYGRLQVDLTASF